MDIKSGIENVTMSDILNLKLASWERPRTTEERRSFVNSHLAKLSFVDDEI